MLRRAIAAFLAAGLWAHGPSHAQVVSSSSAGSRVSRGLGDFHRLSLAAGSLPQGERLGFVNNSINRCVGYAGDDLQWGEVDRWQTPAETLARQLGDCEDFAIAKFFLLHECAAPCACARLMYAIHTPPDTPGRAQAHIVLIGATDADHSNDPLVFDNLNPLLLPVSLRTDLSPVLSFDASALWRGVSGERVGNAALLLRPWRELLLRWRRQQEADRLG
jgi:predicted transglutaminase-like cysteine proteinase